MHLQIFACEGLPQIDLHVLDPGCQHVDLQRPFEDAEHCTLAVAWPLPHAADVLKHDPDELGCLHIAALNCEAADALALAHRLVALSGG